MRHVERKQMNLKSRKICTLDDVILKLRILKTTWEGAAASSKCVAAPLLRSITESRRTQRARCKLRHFISATGFPCVDERENISIPLIGNTYKPRRC